MQVTSLRGAQIDIAQPDRPPPLVIYADGERVGKLPMRFEAVANCLQMAVPPAEKSPT